MHVSLWSWDTPTSRPFVFGFGRDHCGRSTSLPSFHGTQYYPLWKRGKRGIALNDVSPEAARMAR